MLLSLLAACNALCAATSATSAPASAASGIVSPTYEVDAHWPKPLPNHWVLGPVCGVAVDRQQNVWIVHRRVGPPGDAVRVFAPQVLKFAPDGTLLDAWGGPGSGYDWPQEEHGIYVDAGDNVWLAGAGLQDNQILKFDSHGRFMLQIGHPGRNRGSNDIDNVGGAASMVVDEATHELYVADGYVNHRVIVFDSVTGSYRRHWGAYGKRPDDSFYALRGIQPGQHPTNRDAASRAQVASPQFDLVHTVRLSRDGLVYVGDRTNNRIQVFRRDGTFVREVFIANDAGGSGSTSDIGFSTDRRQRWAFVADSSGQRVNVLDRRTLTIKGSFGGPGRAPGQFNTLHNLAVDAQGALFLTEAGGARVQKFVLIQGRGTAQP